MLDTLMISILADISQVYGLDGNYIPWSLIVRPQFVDTLLIVRLRSSMSMCHAVIINY